MWLKGFPNDLIDFKNWVCYARNIVLCYRLACANRLCFDHESFTCSHVLIVIVVKNFLLYVQMGRKAHMDVWKFFDKHVTTKNNKEISGAKCKHCGYTLQVSNATRMKTHIGECEKCPLDIRSRFLNEAHGNEDSPDVPNSIDREYHDYISIILSL